MLKEVLDNHYITLRAPEKILEKISMGMIIVCGEYLTHFMGSFALSTMKS